MKWGRQLEALLCRRVSFAFNLALSPQKNNLGMETYLYKITEFFVCLNAGNNRYSWQIQTLLRKSDIRFEVFGFQENSLGKLINYFKQNFISRKTFEYKPSILLYLGFISLSKDFHSRKRFRVAQEKNGNN